MKKIPDKKAEQLEIQLQKSLDYIEQLEKMYGDECTMSSGLAQRINDILDSMGAFVINSIE